MVSDAIYNIDCMKFMREMEDNSVQLTLTDIPYNAVNRKSNGLRNLDKGEADVMQFDLDEFLNEVYRVTQGTAIIFCGKEQFSKVFGFFAEKQNASKGTVRQLVWKKSNPPVMNGQLVYLSGIENAVWFKKRGAGTFNAMCKNTVFEYPCGRSKVHPTEKHHGLLSELILDNSNEGDVVFDPCAGSGAHLMMAKKNYRRYLGCEINTKWYDIAAERLRIGG